MRGRVNVGSKWIIKVPPNFITIKSSMDWDGVEVQIIGNAQYRKLHPGPIIPFSKVSVLILSAPTDSFYNDRIGEWHTTWRSWLSPLSGFEEEQELNMCICNVSFLISGCKCGGI